MMGCWFCRGDENTPTEGGWYFSWEWDANVHINCLMKTLRDDPYHPEAEVMQREFLITKEDVEDYFK